MQKNIDKMQNNIYTLIIKYFHVLGLPAHIYGHIDHFILEELHNNVKCLKLKNELVFIGYC